MAEDTRAKFRIRKIHRGSQVVFGERAHLQEVLRSVQHAQLPRTRKLVEIRQLKRMIVARTQDLNRFSPAWDRKFQQARDPQTTCRKLLRIGSALHADDYLLARVLTEHAEAPRNCWNIWRRILTRPCGRMWRAIRTPLSQYCGPWRKTQTNLCGFWWPATLSLLPTCVTACGNA